MVDTCALLSHLENLAQKHFGVDSLRPQQREVFASMQKQRQVLAMLPTGSGKTLLYALGSLLFSDAVSIVICPLIALMRDQQQRMTEAGISSVSIYSEQDDEERRQAFRMILQGGAKLLFVSPERFCLSSFQKLIRRLKIGMVVVDEAHCVVTWGHSFRPEYGQLAQLLKNVNAPRILALTATASRSSRELIKEMVFPDPGQVFEVIDKPLNDNIKVESIRVFSEDQRWIEVQRILQETKSSKSILYFNRREQCQKAAQELRKQGFNAVVYHAGLQREFRKSVEEYLRESKRPVVICATLAFGMGVDLPDVQLIVVVGFPGNLEEMFQMMGRAGRKGEQARAAIVWSGSDPKKRSFQFDKTMPEIAEMMERLQRMSSLLPGPQQSTVIPKNQLEQFIRPLVKNERDLTQSIQSVVSALSMLGKGSWLESTRSAWLNLKIERPDVLIALMVDLPAGPSRRRLVLEWLSQRCNLDASRSGTLRMGFALNEMSEDLQLADHRILEVFRYYQDKQVLNFDLIAEQDAQNSVLLAGGLEEIFQLLPRYRKWRSALSQSLQALSVFVTAEDCRMNQAEKFFLPRIGAAANKHRENCGRCDLCESRSRLIVQGTRGLVASPLTQTSPESLR